MSEPLDAGLLAVDPLRLGSWQSEAAAALADEAEAESAAAAAAAMHGAPFPINAEINSKLVLWPGDLATLKATAIVNVSNEHLNDRNPLSVRILDLGGPALQQELTDSVRSCRTGEAKLTKGYRLPARYVIHTVGPRYNAKYRTAAESALYNSTRAVLEQVLDHGVQTLGLAPLHSVKRGYPADEGAHLTLRCLRRFLERHGAGLARLVVATVGPNAARYRDLAQVYFPRCSAELRLSQVTLAGVSLGGPMGEPLHQGRSIRIAASPLGGGEHSDNSRDSSPSPPTETAVAATADSVADAAAASAVADPAADQQPAPPPPPQLLAGAGSHAFARMEASPDSDAARRNRRMAAGHHGGQQHQQHPADIRADRLLASERRYDRWLRRARQQDLGQLRAARCLFHSGHDSRGRPVVVVVASRLPRPAERNYEDLALLVLSVLEPLVQEPYVVVYAHCGYEALPHVAFLKELRDLLAGDPRWAANLACLLHVHADRRTRLFWWWFAKFSAPGLLQQQCQQFADCLHEVFQLVGPDQLDLPDTVYELDRRVAKETKSGAGRKQLDAGPGPGPGPGPGRTPPDEAL